jgi:hypothetical protein
VGTVGALSTAGDQQLVLPAQRQKRIEQQHLRSYAGIWVTARSGGALV